MFVNFSNNTIISYIIKKFDELARKDNYYIKLMSTFLNDCISNFH